MLGRNDLASAARFIGKEYILDAALARLPHTLLVLLDGICMGGGAGLAFGARYKVATERISFAMPETAIGFVPDVGATYYLPRFAGSIGMYLALTGARMSVADCIYTGFATHHVPSSDIAALQVGVEGVPLARMC